MTLIQPYQSTHYTVMRKMQASMVSIRLLEISIKAEHGLQDQTERVLSANLPTHVGDSDGLGNLEFAVSEGGHLHCIA